MLWSIKACARSSPLSRAQVSEVLLLLQVYHPQLMFNVSWVVTQGDKDLTTSLKEMEKTDFFTREIDQLLLNGKCRIAIHSAKDLPDPIPKGLKVIAITEGVDARDCLVFREKESFQQLPKGARVGISSLRREKAIRELRFDLQCIDIRGNIQTRLELLDNKTVDALVMAEAALIRLGLTWRNRIFLPWETAPLQGKLAIVSQEDDLEMERLFACIDSREKVFR